VPYASLVQIATEPDSKPVMLISQLARHTRNLSADSRASLLVDCRAGDEDPLTTHRVTILGRAVPRTSPFGRSRFLRRHPSAKQFVEFADFGFWSLQVELAHSIAGFGRIREISGSDFLIASASAGTSIVDRLAATEDGLLSRLVNQQVLPADTELAGIDCEGFDVRAGAAMQREFFATAIDNPATAEHLIHQHFTVAKSLPPSKDNAHKNH
jgi:putative heme iron utilization protein